MIHVQHFLHHHHHHHLHQLTHHFTHHWFLVPGALSYGALSDCDLFQTYTNYTILATITDTHTNTHVLAQ